MERTNNLENIKFILRGDILSLDKAFEDASKTSPIIYNGYSDDADSVSGTFTKSIPLTDSRDYLYDIAFSIHNRFLNIKTDDILNVIDIDEDTGRIFTVVI